MAHPIQYWYDIIIDEKQSMAELNALQPAIDDSQTLLADLTSTSKVARWRLFIWLIAFGYWLLEIMWDLFFVKVEDTVSKYRTATLRWYQTEVFAWQFGDLLTWVPSSSVGPGKWAYDVIDTSKQVAKYCSATEPGNFVLVKAAQQIGGLPAQLSAEHKTSLGAYLKRKKPGGVNVVLVSFDADRLRMYGDMYYDPLVELAPLKAALDVAVNTFVNNIEFDGKLNLNRLTDTMQAVPGIKDPRLTSVQYTYGSLPYTTIIGEYNMNAGYAKIDPAFPLSATLNWIPYV